MKTRTINISLPQSLYDEAKKHQRDYHYGALSELIRDALRWWLNPRLTRNGFTPAFEREVLRAEKEPLENDVEWDGVTPFHEFVMSRPPKHHGSRATHRNVPSKLQKRGAKRSEPQGSYHPAAAMV